MRKQLQVKLDPIRQKLDENVIQQAQKMIHAPGVPVSHGQQLLLLSRG